MTEPNMLQCKIAFHNMQSLSLNLRLKKSVSVSKCVCTKIYMSLLYVGIIISPYITEVKIQS